MGGAGSKSAKAHAEPLDQTWTCAAAGLTPDVDCEVLLFSTAILLVELHALENGSLPSPRRAGEILEFHSGGAKFL